MGAGLLPLLKGSVNFAIHLGFVLDGLDAEQNAALAAALARLREEAARGC